jgi:hypothetical protein
MLCVFVGRRAGVQGEVRLSSLTGTGKVPTGWNSYCSQGMPSRHCDSNGLRFSGQRRKGSLGEEAAEEREGGHQRE